MAATADANCTAQSAHECYDYEVLLNCLQQALRANRNIKSLSISVARVCWSKLLELAQRHEVVPLLNLGLRDASGIPETVQRWLESYCRTVVAHNLSLASELVAVLDLLETFQLTAVPYKGPLWTVALYGNLALRQITDLDIFIDKCQAGRVLRLLSDSGYILPEKPPAMPIEEISLDSRNPDRKDIELIHSKTGIPLELHWSACEPSFDKHLSSVKLWQPISTTTLLDRQIPMPSPEDLFILLALHGFRHRWESLKWICDIDAAVRAFPDLDWTALLSKAAKLSRKRMVLLPLALVQRVFDTQLAPCVVEAIAHDAPVRALAWKLQQQHYTRSNDNFGPNDGLSRFIERESIRIRSREKFWERLNTLATLLLSRFKPTPNDRHYFLPYRLPVPLYWLLRPVRVVSIYGLSFLTKLTRQLINLACRP